MVEEVVRSAVRKCPFLGHLAQARGEDFACSVASNHATPFPGPIFPESIADVVSTFKLFHGAKGLVPLVEAKQCPFHHSVQQPQSRDATLPERPKQCVMEHELETTCTAPFASLSTRTFRFLPGPDEFIRRHRKRRQERKDRKNNRNDSSKQNSGKAKAKQFRSGLDKWRSHPIVGGLIPLNAAGKYVCPPLVVAGRAAVARMKSTQLLRPQALPVKLLGVGGHCLASNIPCGMAREHTEKFSPAWFLAVHATVPYFGFLRKGVGMPKWAILMTLITAIVGQTIGSRLERARLRTDLFSSIGNQPQVLSRAPLLRRQLNASKHGTNCPLLKTCNEMAQASNSNANSSVLPRIMAGN